MANFHYVFSIVLQIWMILMFQNASGLTAQQRAKHAITGRGVTLAMLMDDCIIQPGENVLSIDYLVRFDKSFYMVLQVKDMCY